LILEKKSSKSNIILYQLGVALFESINTSTQSEFKKLARKGTLGFNTQTIKQQVLKYIKLESIRKVKCEEIRVLTIKAWYSMNKCKLKQHFAKRKEEFNIAT
jgi:hypothetical protein